MAVAVFCTTETSNLTNLKSCLQAGRFKDAFTLFNKMLDGNIELDKFLAASMLSACTGLGALNQGQWIHKHIEKSDIKLATAIIDMYIKCGCLEKACDVFNGLETKGQSSYNCMIGGFTIHGRGDEAIDLFKEMERSKVTPDGRHHPFEFTWCMCTFRGLVDKGKYYFDYMVNKYGVEPKMEHFGCLVDMLGRAKMFDEANRVIDDIGDEEKENPLYYHSEKLAIAFGLLKMKKGVIIRISKNLRVCRDCQEASKLVSTVYD